MNECMCATVSRHVVQIPPGPHPARMIQTAQVIEKNKQVSVILEAPRSGRSSGPSMCVFAKNRRVMQVPTRHA